MYAIVLLSVNQQTSSAVPSGPSVIAELLAQSSYKQEIKL